jgi:hypothetical protein
MVFPDRGVAQVLGESPRPLPRLEEARLAALRARIRRHALSLKPEDIANLSPSIKSPMGPEKPKVQPPATQPAHAPDASAPSADAKKPAGPAHAHEPAKKPEHPKKPKDKDKAKKPPFDPYPHGHEPHAPALPPGYHPDVRVLAPGRLDWTFVVSPQSLDPVPTALTAGYVSTRRSYELYVPPRHPPRQPYALILHVPTGLRSDGWQHWQRTCQRHGVMLAGVHRAGNAVPMEARARIVLDVLDDVRRRFPVDPDRTYITGISGAGHATGCIAHALPELFGGHIAICGEWNLRVEAMLRLRVSERLSVAVLTGATDFNRPELQREFFPILQNQQVRSQLWVYPGMGHGCPGPAQLEQVFQWVEAGLPQRRVSGSLFLASRLSRALPPAEWSTLVLLEAAQRLEMPGGEASGLFMLQGAVDRWQGLPAADIAQKLLDEFDATSPVPWKDIYRGERLRFRYLQAKMFDGIVNSQPPPNYPVPRINLLEIAIALWQEIHDLVPAKSPIIGEANARLAVLHQQAGK